MSATSELTLQSGSITRLASELSRACQKVRLYDTFLSNLRHGNSDIDSSVAAMVMETTTSTAMTKTTATATAMATAAAMETVTATAMVMVTAMEI